MKSISEQLSLRSAWLCVFSIRSMMQPKASWGCALRVVPGVEKHRRAMSFVFGCVEKFRHEKTSSEHLKVKDEICAAFESKKPLAFDRLNHPSFKNWWWIDDNWRCGESEVASSRQKKLGAPFQFTHQPLRWTLYGIRKCIYTWNLCVLYFGGWTLQNKVELPIKTRVIWVYIYILSPEVSELIQVRKQKTQSTPKPPLINGNPSPFATHSEKKKTYTSGQQGCTIQFLATRYTRFRRRGIRVYMRKFKTSTGMYQMMDVYNS